MEKNSPVASRVPPGARALNSRHSLLLVGATLLCLLPFCGKAFHIDDPLFIWSAQQITRHPLDPFGFQVTWDRTLTPMSQVTKNPPLTCYYAAAIGAIAGWSEQTLHLWFLLPAVALVLGTYLLAQHLTSSPLFAVLATLLTPGVIVSASSIMSDVLMLGLWIWAIVLWLEGFQPQKSWKLLASSLLMAAAALTKYFAISLVPLLLVYSLVKHRHLEKKLLYLAVPIAALIAYQSWTHALYGHGMFSDAVMFAPQRISGAPHWTLVSLLTCAAFVGGCALSVLLLAPLLWSRRVLLLAAAAAGGFVAGGWIVLRTHLSATRMGPILLQHWGITGVELAVCIGAGISIIALAFLDLWKNRDADSLLLALWVLGTFFFAAFVNWAINARSVLPLVPAAAILAARRLDAPRKSGFKRLRTAATLLVLASGLTSMEVAESDAALANSAREAATRLHKRTQGEKAAVWFQGHWGFQYYMQQLGFRPFDFQKCTLNPGDLLIVPGNAAETTPLPPQFVAEREELAIPLSRLVVTHRWQMGAGFYGSYFGPLPFTFGEAGAETYTLSRIGTAMRPEQWGFTPHGSERNKRD